MTNAGQALARGSERAASVVASWAYAVDGQSFTGAIVWDRHFGDGTLASIGEYEVVVEARDVVGNVTWETAHIVIPAPNVTATPLPTRTPLPTFTATTETSRVTADTPTITPTRTPIVAAFGGTMVQSVNPPISQSQNQPLSNVLWGATAGAAIAAATGLALAERKRRKEEEARQARAARAEAARRNAAEAARKVQEYLLSQLAARQIYSSSCPLHIDPATADMTEFEQLIQYKQSLEYQASQERMYKWKTQRAHRQGKRKSHVTTPKTISVMPKILGDGRVPIFLVVVIMGISVLVVDPWRRHGISAEPTCTDTYANCFKNSERLPLKNGQNLDAQQFDEMLDAIHEDLSSKWRTPFDLGRAAYDTPFWNGNPGFGKSIYDDEVVCLMINALHARRLIM